MQFLFLAQATSEWSIWVGPGLALLGAIALAVVGYFALKRKRLMQNVPTSKVKGVFIGLNELKGGCRVETPLTSFLARKECIWYSYKIEEEWERSETTNDGEGNSKTERKTGWTTIDSGEERQPFQLEDDTGQIRVLPEKAKFIGDQVLYDTVRRTESLYRDRGPRIEIADSTGRRRFVEHAIPIDAEIYCLGSARVREDVVEPEIAYDELDKLFLISSKSEAALTMRYALMSTFSFLGGTVAMAFFPWALAFALNGGESSVPLQPLYMILSVFLYGLIVCGLYLSLIYNGLVSVMQRVQRAWSLVEIQLQRRFDLIPRLVECTKAYMNHEVDVQAGAAGARATGKSLIPSSESVNQQAAATDAQTASIGKMVALAEGYPDLKANELFQKLSDSLVDTEDRISLSRNFFNDSVTAYNNRIQKLPDVVFAMAFKYQPAQLYQIQDFERALVEVELGDDEEPAASPGGGEETPGEPN